MIKAAIIGANGYTGMELLRILASHKQVSVVYACSRSWEGKELTSLSPSLSAYGNMKFSALNVDEIAKECDVVFCCLPHGTTFDYVGAFYEKGLCVIDLSADFRYQNLEQYEKTYKVTHLQPQLLKNAVYGLPEFYRDKIKGAKLIANPGCFVTCSLLALYPLLYHKLISLNDIIVDAKSGVSGAGKKLAEANLFSEVNENFKAYAVGTHRHTSEIEEQLSLAANTSVNITFTPHLIPLQRGILSTIYTKPMSGVGEKEIAQAYASFYKDSPFVETANGRYPELKHVKGSNCCKIGYHLDERTGKLLLISVLDNLVKGASGQAVQNMNVAFSLSETEALTQTAMYL